MEINHFDPSKLNDIVQGKNYSSNYQKVFTNWDTSNTDNINENDKVINFFHY